MQTTPTVRRARTINTILAILAISLVARAADAVGNPVRLSIEPKDQVLQAGQRVAYTVTGVDADGASRDVTAFVQLTTDDPYGTVGGATYTAGKAGTWTVTALLNALATSTPVTVAAGPPATIAINPDSAPELLSPGQGRQFGILAYDAMNNRVEAPAAIWSVDEAIGTVDGTGRFTATTIGTGKLTATGPEGLRDVIVLKVRGEVLTNANTSAAITAPSAANANVAAVGEEESATSEEQSLVAPETTGATAETATETACTTSSTSAWASLIILYAIVIAGIYAWLRRSSTDWWWIAPAIVTAGGLWLFAARRCEDQYAWWPYTILGIGVILSFLYLWMRPRREQLGINI